MIEVRELNVVDSSAPVALVVPGAGYTAQGPLLYWSAEALAAGGWHVYTLMWSPPADVLERARAFVEDALDHAEEMISRPPQLLVGKSLGSFALPYSVDAGIPGIWLTPILTDSTVASAMRMASHKHLAIGGSADPAWQPAAAEGTEATLHTAKGMDHSLELVPNDWRATIGEQLSLVERIAAHAQTIRHDLVGGERPIP